MNISAWLNSQNYPIQIDDILHRITKGAEQSQNESQTAQIFEQEIYYLLREQLGVELNIQKEHPVSNIQHTIDVLAKRQSGKGRLDAIVNNLVIEYKHHSKLLTETQQTTAIQQVVDYLDALYKQKNIKYDAILTDGLHICYFSFIGEDVKHTTLHSIKQEDIDRIIRAILNNQHKKFEPRNIVADFAVSATHDSKTKDVARILYTMITEHPTGKTIMLFEEWKALMRLSADDNGKSSDIQKRRNDLSLLFDTDIYDNETEHRALFALQTAYAVLVKLIACKVVDKLATSDRQTIEYHNLYTENFTSDKLQAFFQSLEDGYTYTNMGVHNFLEGDYFSWYADKNQWTRDFYIVIRDIMEMLDDYSAFSLDVRYNPIDIFKDLYMSIIPQSVRHSMGEYFTPEWLADSVIEGAMQIRQTDNWKAIDPCCGSGIFLIALIKKIVGENISLTELSKQEKEDILHHILHRVYGVDINPLSVLSARVSYFMALHQLGNIQNVEIPVFLGDSAVVPVSVLIDDIECYKYQIDNTQKGFSVVLPKRLVKTDTFTQDMNQLQSLVQVEDTNLLYEAFCKLLSPEEQQSLKLKECLEQLSQDLVALHQQQWDGIWIRIVTNFMLIARLQEFDYIVGNPPWVKWEHLPAKYAEKIKTFCDVKHIFCNDSLFGGAQLNICALISNVVATNWLAPNGVLAFLMPDSIMSQNSYEEFRNFYIDYATGKRLYLQKIDRWVAPLRPFRSGNKVVSQDFNTYYFTADMVSYKTGIPVQEISRQKTISDADLNLIHIFSKAKKYLTFKQYTAIQNAADSTAFTYTSEQYDYSAIAGESDYEYRTGVESTPFEVFKLIGIAPSQEAEHFLFKNDVRKTAKYKVTNIPSMGWNLPTRYIYPMVEGPCISPFEFTFRNNYHIVPYTSSNTKQPVALNDLLSTDNKLALYLVNNKKLLEQQAEKSKMMHRGEEFYALSKIGVYTFAPHIVAARDNSSFCATVVAPIKTQWGEYKHPICVKHTIIISQDTKKQFITEQEAYYINGILNSSIVRAYMHSTFKKNGFSLKKAHLYIPKYDRDNKIMREIAIKSKQATDKTIEKKMAAQELTTLYLQLCSQPHKTPLKSIPTAANSGKSPQTPAEPLTA